MNLIIRFMFQEADEERDSTETNLFTTQIFIIRFDRWDSLISQSNVVNSSCGTCCNPHGTLHHSCLLSFIHPRAAVISNCTTQAHLRCTFTGAASVFVIHYAFSRCFSCPSVTRVLAAEEVLCFHVRTQACSFGFQTCRTLHL